MTSLQLPIVWQKSYEDFRSYPCNIAYKTTYPATLEASKIRLSNAATKLFNERPNQLHVPFRDWNASVQKFERSNIYSDKELKDWIGDRSSVDPQTSCCVGELATRRDPTCRFIFLYADNSTVPLNLSKDMLVRILSYHQVMPGYLDFLSVFGSQMKPRDLGFSSFHQQMTLTAGSGGDLAVDSLGRSGQQYQMCYNLKAAACRSDSGVPAKEQKWSIRQAAFHHQFDVVEGTTLWISAKGRLEDLKQCIEALTGKDGRAEDRAFRTPVECFKSSLAVHLAYCHWATENWRWYIRCLEEIVDEETQLAVIQTHDANHAQRLYRSEDVQGIQYYEDKTNETIMVLEANVDVMKSLRNFYLKLLEDSAFPLRSECRNNVLSFAGQLNEMLYDSNMQIKRAKLLVRISADRKNLITQHLQTQATDKMEILASLSHREAIAMRIITVVTLVYLPATFVSTFFSTDIIKYQNQPDGNGTYSHVAMQRWLQVTIPLTLLTLGIGYIGVLAARKRAPGQRSWLPFYRQDVKLS